MARTLLLITCLALLLRSSAQAPLRGEFATYSNGLMYSDADMKALRFVVDSLNLRFKSCDLDKPYYSLPQARVYYLTFSSETNDLHEIIAELANNPDFHTLAEKYASFVGTRDSGQLLIRLESEKDGPYYLQGDAGAGYQTNYELNKEKKFTGKNISRSWFYNYSPKDRNRNYYSLSCRYFPKDWNTQRIPDEYARLIQYVDCMIDTNSTIFKEPAVAAQERRNDNWHVTVNDYLNTAMHAKKKGKKDWEYNAITQKKIDYAARHLRGDEKFVGLLRNAADDAIAGKTYGGAQLEELIALFISKEKALALKRMRKVYGMCSMDQSPRIHARSIAILAAETHSWDIFLRAHLDIMNDRFERQSDGSYAWKNRETYLKELEELDLNVIDLMLGLTLRAAGINPNHYYGTVWRLGWALAESRDREKFEERAQAMVKDNALDEFNRGLIFLLYNSYIHRLERTEANKKISQLQATVASYPSFIQPSIHELKLIKEREVKD